MLMCGYISEEGKHMAYSTELVWHNMACALIAYV